MEQLIEAYGPYAFGLVSLMILWYTIVRPQVQIQNTQSETLRQTVDILKETAHTNREVTKELRGVVNDLRELNKEEALCRMQERQTASTPMNGSIKRSSNA